MGASVEIQGRSFAIIAEVSVDTTGAEGVIIKHGGAHALSLTGANTSR